jgi:hypothetical protein
MVILNDLALVISNCTEKICSKKIAIISIFQIDWEVREVELEGIQQQSFVLAENRGAEIFSELPEKKSEASLAQQLQQTLELNRC